MQKNWIHWVIFTVGLLVADLPLRLPAQSASLFSQINSRYDEQFPVLASDGQTLYFVRDRHPNNMGVEDLPDIWRSDRQGDGSWGPPMHMGLPVNNLKSNRLVGLGPHEQTLYLAENDGYLGWISITYREGRRWSNPQAMIIDRFVSEAAASFSVSCDEQILLIASRQDDGRGETDIYVSFRLDERRWSHPLNLGSAINTSGRESWAMIAADGQTLYLAADGYAGGSGGLDLWMSRRLDDSWQNWTPPVNLGPAVNTPADEWSMAMAGDGGSIVVDRRSEPQQYDLVRLSLAPDLQPYPVAILTGRILDENSAQPQAGEIFYRFSGAEKTAPRPLKLSAGAAYRVVVPLNWGAEFYGALPGYLPLSERFAAAPSAAQIDSANPQIAAWAGINAYYWQEENIIHSIQNQLQLIQDELEAMDKERRAHRRQVAERTYDELENEDIPGDDPEIEALERRFNILLRSVQDSLSLGNASFKDLQPVGTTGGDLRKDFIDEPADEQTARLKETLRAQRSTVEVTSPNPSTKELPAAVTFQDLKKRAEKELTYEMLSRVQAELVQELFPPAWRSLQQGVSETLFKILTEEEDSIRIYIRQGLGQFIMAPDAFEEYAGPELEWLSQLKTDLKNVMRQPVRNHLKQSLRPYILDAIRIELNFQVKELMEARQRQALDFKIKQQQVIETSSDEVEPYLGQTPVAPLPASSAEEALSYMEIRKDLMLTSIEEGCALELKNVRFQPDGLELAPGAEAELERILRFLQENPKINIQIRAHTHGWCDHVKAINLTEGRARLIAAYFLERGIRPARVKYAGLGKTSPLLDNNTLAGRAANQRIELKILSTDN